MQLLSMSGLDAYQRLVKAEIHNEAFRLSEDEFNADENSVVDLQSTIGSISSKERIDLMFRSAHYQQFEYGNNERVGKDQRARSLEGKRSAELYYDEEYELPGDEVKNDIQLRIEKMFSEINGSEEYSMPDKRQFPVKYMGSVPVSGKINSLEGLQTPVSELYFKYRKNEAPDEQSIFDSIEVTLNGLQVEHVSKAANKPILKMYPFSCIAVWVSVKLFCRKRIGGNQQWEYAFLPLVADTENEAENKAGNGCSLFQRLDTARRTKHFRNRNFDDNSPLFVVVLRETDFQCKQLACQGFVCRSSDEAIALADTLYTVLNSKLRRSQILRTRNQRRRLRYKNGMSRLSSIGETATESLENLQDDDFEQQRPAVHRSSSVARRSVAEALDEAAEKLSTATTSKPPKRPPRRRKAVDKHRYIDDADDPTTPLLNQPDDNRKKKVHRSRSNASSEMAGDVLTKIVIPRSRSFLNSDRLSSRYKKRQQQQASVVTEQSPLDFTELFGELRMQEGLTSLEQVLNVIVNADGMSFTDLKPIYKEFLLKLALVLSKDELYDRSKLIMKKQRRKREKRRRIGKFASTKKRLKNIFQPVRRLRSRTTGKFGGAKNRYNGNNNNNNNPGDSTSTDSFFLSKTPLQSAPIAPPTKYRSTDYKSRQLNPRHRYHNKDKDSSLDGAFRGSSSGYFSFSECSYDTESCMCATVDRCYCSMVRRKIGEPSATVEQVQRTTAFESRKKLGELSLVEQLKMKGFAASESSGSSEMGASSFHAHRDISKQRGATAKKSNDNFKCPKRMDVYKSSSHVPLQRPDFCRCCSDGRRREYSTSLSTGSSKNSTDNLTTVDYNLFAPSTASTKNLCRHRHHWQDSRHSCRTSGTVYAELSHPALSPTFQQRFHRPCERAVGNFHKMKVIYEREPTYNERLTNDDEARYYSACKCSNCNSRNGYSNYHNDRLHRKIDNDEGAMLPDEYYRKKNKNSKRNYRHHRYKKSDNYFGY